MIDQSESQLIKDILNGQSHLYDIIVKRYQDIAFGLALGIVNNREEAEEAAHDAFIKAFKGLGSFKGDSKFSTWLYRIVYNTAVSYARKKKYHKEPTSALHNMRAEEAEGVEQDERKFYLNLALSRLEENDRNILKLFYLKEFSLEEISSISQTSVNTLKVRLHRARKKMAEELTTLLQKEALNL